MQIRREILWQFGSEKIIQHGGTRVVTRFLHQRLLVYLQEAGRYLGPFDGEVIQFKTQQGAACILKLVASQFRISPAGKVFTHQQLRLETHFPYTDILVRHQCVAYAWRIDDLFEQQVGMIDHFSCGKRPVGTHTLTAHAAAVHDARVGMSTGRD